MSGYDGWGQLWSRLSDLTARSCTFHVQLCVHYAVQFDGWPVTSRYAGHNVLSITWHATSSRDLPCWLLTFLCGKRVTTRDAMIPFCMGWQWRHFVYITCATANLQFTRQQQCKVLHLRMNTFEIQYVYWPTIDSRHIHSINNYKRQTEDINNTEK